MSDKGQGWKVQVQVFRELFSFWHACGAVEMKKHPRLAESSCFYYEHTNTRNEEGSFIHSDGISNQTKLCVVLCRLLVWFPPLIN